MILVLIVEWYPDARKNARIWSEKRTKAKRWRKYTERKQTNIRIRLCNVHAEQTYEKKNGLPSVPQSRILQLENILVRRDWNTKKISYSSCGFIKGTLHRPLQLELDLFAEEKSRKFSQETLELQCSQNAILSPENHVHEFIGRMRLRLV